MATIAAALPSEVVPETDEVQVAADCYPNCCDNRKHDALGSKEACDAEMFMVDSGKEIDYSTCPVPHLALPPQAVSFPETSVVGFLLEVSPFPRHITGKTCFETLQNPSTRMLL